jgi:hypothetical protein
VFPPRRDVGTRVGARTHTRRGETGCSSRSEAETCAGGLSWHNRPGEGETKLNVSAEMERSGMEDESLLNNGDVSVHNRAGGGVSCDLNQLLAAIGTNYLPQVQRKPGDFVSRPCLRFLFLEPLNCGKCNSEKENGRSAVVRIWSAYSLKSYKQDAR